MVEETISFLYARLSFARTRSLQVNDIYVTQTEMVTPSNIDQFCGVACIASYMVLILNNQQSAGYVIAWCVLRVVFVCAYLKV